MTNKTSQGTVKVVNPDTNGQVKPKRSKNIAEVEKMLKEILYTKPLTNEQKLHLWQNLLIHELGFKQTHADIEKRLEKLEISENDKKLVAMGVLQPNGNLRPYSSFKKRQGSNPLDADEANFFGMDE